MFGFKDKYKKKAESLIFLANTTALGSTSLYDHFPILYNIVEDDRTLIFIMTIVGVGVGITLIDDEVSENEFMKFSYAIADELKNWDSQGYNPYGREGAYKAYTDLANFIRGKEAEAYFVGVGFWLVTNIKGSHASKEEIIVGTAISKMIATSLFGWWNKV